MVQTELCDVEVSDRPQVLALCLVQRLQRLDRQALTFVDSLPVSSV
jgi:hypothetical protein